jgi:NAD(P)-dependent dehydrogenase (short-subunit alcohol dehydrogenase family)
MKDLAGRTAVITGAASGFGREFALRAAQAGMRLVLADLQEEGLKETASMLGGAASLSVRTDVSDPAAVDALAEAAYARFGAVHIVFNNAGVAVAGPAWSATLEDWQWSIGVNLMGVVHGVRSFVPRMLAGGEPGHIVNTASVAGLLAVPGSSVYCATKQAVVALSECLYHDLRLIDAKVGVSVLCPAFVNTGIGSSERNRPAELAATNPLGEAAIEGMRAALRKGKLTAADIAAMTFEAIEADRFWILTHAKIKGAISLRFEDILGDRQPTSPMG